MKNRTTQKDRVLQYLQEKRSITSWEAIKEFNYTRLGDAIYNLKKEGYNIETVFVTKKNKYNDKVTFARYELGE